MARFGRKTKREEIAGLNAAFRFYGMQQFEKPLPKQRAPRKPSGKPLERNILKAIIDALRKHPLVARVVRNQSGQFGTVRVGYVGKPDLTVYLRSGRWGEIEVKRPGEQPNDRQHRQLARTIEAGGFSGCAHSVAEAVGIIERAASGDPHGSGGVGVGR